MGALRLSRKAWTSVGSQHKLRSAEQVSTKERLTSEEDLDLYACREEVGELGEGNKVSQVSCAALGGSAEVLVALRSDAASCRALLLSQMQ